MSAGNRATAHRGRWLLVLMVVTGIVSAGIWANSPEGRAARLNAMDTSALLIYTSQHPDEPAGLMALGRRMERLGNATEALNDYLEAARARPGDSAAWLTAFRLARRLGDGNAALLAAQSAARAAPASAVAQMAVGDTYALANQWEEARGAYRAATQSDPHNAEAWSGLSEAATRRADLAEALQAARMAAEREGRNVRYLLQLARAYRATGALADALVTSASALQYEPHNPDALLEQGIERAQMARTNEEREAAASALRQAAQIWDNTARAYAPLYQIGQMELARGRWTEAERALRSALRVKPKDEAAVFALSRVLALAGHPAASAALLTRFQAASGVRLALTQLRLRIQREPNRADLYAQLADLSAGQGDWGDATAAWQRSLALNPDQPKTRQRLNAALQRQSSALSDLRPAKIDPP